MSMDNIQLPVPLTDLKDFTPADLMAYGMQFAPYPVHMGGSDSVLCYWDIFKQYDVCSVAPQPNPERPDYIATIETPRPPITPPVNAVPEPHLVSWTLAIAVWLAVLKFYKKRRA